VTGNSRVSSTRPVTSTRWHLCPGDWQV
jgi:hypothetical protein